MSRPALVLRGNVMPQTPAPILLAGAARSSEFETTEHEESEFARVESLLALRTRNLGTLQREFERRDRLLREALERLTARSSEELRALRQRHDAAARRAVEAELARAELRFELDEARAQLTAAEAIGAVSPLADTDRLRLRVAELQKVEEQLRAKLLLFEQERDSAQHRVLELERDLAKATEAPAPEPTALVPPSATFGDALRGECSGLRARLEETERALERASERTGERLAAAAQRDTWEARIRELEEREQTAHVAVAAERDSWELRLRELQGREDAARAAVAAERESWETRVRELEERERAARGAAAAERDSWMARIRELEEREQAARIAIAAERGSWELRSRELIEGREQAAQTAVVAERDAWEARVRELEQRDQAARTAAAAERDAWELQLRELEARELGVRKALEAERDAWELRVREIEDREHSLRRTIEAEREAWELRFRELDERDRAARKSAAAARQRLQTFLTTLEQPLRQLDASLDGLHPASPRTQGASPLTAAELDVAVEGEPELLEQLAASERHIVELEARLVELQQRVSAGVREVSGEDPASARVAEILTAEQARRHKLIVTVRAMQAAAAAGEAVQPWIEHLLQTLAEAGPPLARRA